MNNVGEKIRIQRLIKNYSQEYMAFNLEISQAAYSKLERDETEISLNRIFAIAEILEISPYILMPKPKYSFGINHELVLRTLNKLRKFFSSRFKKKKTGRPYSKNLEIVHRDNSKTGAN